MTESYADLSCGRHALRGARGRLLPVPVEERFWPKVDRRGPDECWPWLATLDRYGYGTFHDGRRLTGAHRMAYELLRGPIPDGLELDHLCRTRGCVNPAHLEAVTHRENMGRSRGLHGRASREGRT